ncbi:MAG: GNAT family N-acetyltransferase [Lachnospiraceae bacterium]|nr:GNAT family N-acetyltransferase [Robinsoniella sp.]MDY3767422.1 GNAT family N-acetyltransferase [Lachnospiraceae bacterium]
MIFREAQERDLESIMAIIHQAQEDLKNQGVDQWQNGYPNEEIVLGDINRKENYVLEDGGEIAATVMFSFAGEPSYEKIYEGEWKSDQPYAVIHRIAVDRSRKHAGAATKMLDEIIRICRQRDISSIRIDTHRDNKAMQGWIIKNQFDYCGTIYLKSSGAQRYAYERRL